MTNPLAQDLGGVVRLLEKATPGPYEASHPIEPGFGFGAWSTIAGDDEIVVAQCQFPADANAVAAAINFLRTHSAEIAGALREADRYRKLKEHFSARYHRATMDYWVLDGEVKTASQFFTDEIDLTLDAALDAMQQGGGGGDHA